MALMTAPACSQISAPPATNKAPAPFGHTVPGSYIVQASGDGEVEIRRVFAQFDIVLVRPLGGKQFEMQLQGDPGLDVLKRLAANSKGAITAIQPNFVYRMK